MNNFIYEHPVIFILLVSLILFGVIGGTAIKIEAIHQNKLKKLGCELYSDSLTGHEVYCGKACFRPEHIRIYNCYKGKRIEID